MGKFDGVLLASDMDGTLLNDQRKIDQGNIEALNYFTQNGGYFALATGRTRPATDAYRGLLPCNCPGVYLNGAILCDERTEKIVYMEGLDERARTIAKKIMREYPHIGIEVFLVDRSYVCNMCEVTRVHFENLDIPYTVMDMDAIPEPVGQWGKINFTGETQEVEVVRQALEEMEPYYNLTFSTPVFYEMTCKGGHKGDGVQRVADYLSVRPEDIYTAGDSQNDIPMLRMASKSFVPENGRQDVLALADVVVSDNNHCVMRDIVDYLDKVY
ncbi:MAG: Cof-type HAD-IIB family hydrolase [Eubacteriales bacterium]|nr:Cof-type HAD-IIB family hydrolase [Eubacteriales bacterium]